MKGVDLPEQHTTRTLTCDPLAVKYLNMSYLIHPKKMDPQMLFLYQVGKWSSKS